MEHAVVGDDNLDDNRLAAWLTRTRLMPALNRGCRHAESLAYETREVISVLPANSAPKRPVVQEDPRQGALLRRVVRPGYGAGSLSARRGRSTRWASGYERSGPGMDGQGNRQRVPCVADGTRFFPDRLELHGSRTARMVQLFGRPEIVHLVWFRGTVNDDSRPRQDLPCATSPCRQAPEAM
jgi:hypothetical protein